MKILKELHRLPDMIESSRNIRSTASGMLAASNETATGNNKFEALSWNLLLLMAGIGSLCYVFRIVIRNSHTAESHDGI